MINANQTAQTQIQILSQGSRLDLVYETIDELHTAICEGQLEKLPEFDSPADMINWLCDVVYTAQETISELEKAQVKAEPMLRVVHRHPTGKGRIKRRRQT